jgi:hypothetical protein
MVNIKIVIKELQLTKILDKVVKEPFNLYFLVKTMNFEVRTNTKKNAKSLSEWEEDIRIQANLDGKISITVFNVVNDMHIDMGALSVDIEPFSMLKRFTGRIPLFYRCTKVANLICEMYAVNDETNYITLGSELVASTTHAIPIKDYPA